MYCTRKHLVFDKSYLIFLNPDNVSIGESTKNIKYVIPLNLKTIIDWKVDEENQFEIYAFAIQWRGEWKYFYASSGVCQRLKQHLDGRVCYQNLDIFYEFHEKVEIKTMSSVKTIKQLQGGQVLICKEIQKQKRFADFLFSNEIETLKMLKHKNIIELVGAFENTYNYQIILEYAKGGSLKQCLKYCKLKIEETNIIIQQLLEAIVYLHSQGYVHRDLKPENLLFSELGNFSQLKIIDFGISTQIKKLESEREMKFGTPGYMAPEILSQSQKNKVSEKIDVFSCGAILFYMLTGKPMIQGLSQKELTNNNKAFQYTNELGQKIAEPKYRDLVSRMVAQDPKNRLSAQEALTMFRLFNVPISMSTSLQCYQDPIQLLPDFNKLIAKA